MQTQKFKASEIIKELEQEVGVFFERLEQELKQRNPWNGTLVKRVAVSARKVDFILRKPVKRHLKREELVGVWVKKVEFGEKPLQRDKWLRVAVENPRIEAINRKNEAGIRNWDPGDQKPVR